MSIDLNIINVWRNPYSCNVDVMHNTISPMKAVCQNCLYRRNLFKIFALKLSGDIFVLLLLNNFDLVIL